MCYRAASLQMVPTCHKHGFAAQCLTGVPRKGERANDRFVEFYCAKTGFGWAAALEKADGPLRVGSCCRWYKSVEIQRQVTGELPTDSECIPKVRSGL